MKQINHTQRAHSAIGASQAERWMNCPPSVPLCETVPKKATHDAAEKGTAAHELAEHCLKKGLDAVECKGDIFNDFMVDDEMINGVQIYLDHVRETLAQYKHLNAELLIEKKFHLKEIDKDLYGTSDIIIRVPFLFIIVMDYKNGIKIVEVEDNPQLKIYGLGASWGDDYGDVFLHIIQPNAAHEDGPIRIWKTDHETLLGWVPVLKKAIAETRNPKAKFKVGSWCQYCAAAAVCPEQRKELMATAQTDFDDPVLPEVESLDDVQLVKIIEHRKMFENYFKSVKDFALARLIKGEKIPGLKLVRGKGSRNWNNDRAMMQKYGKQIMEPPRLMSVSQAEKVIGVKELKGEWKKFEGNVTLAHENDRRKAVANAKDDFDAIEVDYEVQNDEWD